MGHVAMRHTTVALVYVGASPMPEQRSYHWGAGQRRYRKIKRPFPPTACAHPVLGSARTPRMARPGARLAGRARGAPRQRLARARPDRGLGTERRRGWESERRLTAGNVYIFGLDEQYAIDSDTPKDTARYINHSCDPNCQTEQFGRIIWIVAIRDIRAGEELRSCPCRLRINLPGSPVAHRRGKKA